MNCTRKHWCILRNGHCDLPPDPSSEIKDLWSQLWELPLDSPQPLEMDSKGLPWLKTLPRPYPQTHPSTRKLPSRDGSVGILKPGPVATSQNSSSSSLYHKNTPWGPLRHSTETVRSCFLPSHIPKRHSLYNFCTLMPVSRLVSWEFQLETLGLITSNICSLKDTVSKMKRQAVDWENIFTIRILIKDMYL